MKALTLTQPWATLVHVKAKLIETRSWYTSHRGPLVIHAASSYPREARELAQTAPFSRALGQLDPLELPLGVGLCVVTVVGCVKTEHVGKLKEMGFPLHIDELRFGNFQPGRWAWALKYEYSFPKAIVAKGARRIWEWPQRELLFPTGCGPKQIVFSDFIETKAQQRAK